MELGEQFGLLPLLGYVACPTKSRRVSEKRDSALPVLEPSDPFSSSIHTEVSTSVIAGLAVVYCQGDAPRPYPRASPAGPPAKALAQRTEVDSESCEGGGAPPGRG
jgi:hypothetical protein